MHILINEVLHANKLFKSGQTRQHRSSHLMSLNKLLHVIYANYEALVFSIWHYVALFINGLFYSKKKCHIIHINYV